MSIFKNKKRHDLYFHGAFYGFRLDVFVDDDKPIMFSRSKRRWRICGGYYCKSNVVAMNIFDITDDYGFCKVSESDWDEAVDYVETMAATLDLALSSFTDYERRKREDEEKKREEELNARIAEYQKSAFNSEKTDWIYLMRHSNGLTKIGRSNNPRAREHTLQAEDPRLRLIFKAKDCGYLERGLHSRFAELRKRGEWFDLTEEQVRWIKRYCYDLEPVENAIT